jgi:hypothetical protein
MLSGVEYASALQYSIPMYVENDGANPVVNFRTFGYRTVQ